jgi:hypothetical protein
MMRVVAFEAGEARHRNEVFGNLRSFGPRPFRQRGFSISRNERRSGLVNANWGEATQAIQTYDAMIKSPSGYSMQLTYVSIANCQTEIMLRFASECGFTPGSPKSDQCTRRGLAVAFDRTPIE